MMVSYSVLAVEEVVTVTPTLVQNLQLRPAKRVASATAAFWSGLRCSPVILYLRIASVIPWRLVRYSMRRSAGGSCEWNPGESRDVFGAATSGECVSQGLEDDAVFSRVDGARVEEERVALNTGDDRRSMGSQAAGHDFGRESRA